jgi:hypothetical protein
MREGLILCTEKEEEENEWWGWWMDVWGRLARRARTSRSSPIDITSVQAGTTKTFFRKIHERNIKREFILNDEISTIYVWFVVNFRIKVVSFIRLNDMDVCFFIFQDTKEQKFSTLYSQKIDENLFNYFFSKYDSKTMVQ